LRSAGWRSTRRRRRGYGTSSRTSAIAESERLSLRLFGRLRLLDLALRRRRIKSLQHEFLIGDYQNNRQNDRDQNSTRIQKSYSLRVKSRELGGTGS